MSDHTAGVRRTLPPHPSSVGHARRLVRGALGRADRDDLAEVAELLVSEVVTNALVHAGTPIEVHARVGRRGLRVEVADGSGMVPAMRHHAPLAGTGRGLRLLHVLAGAWGTEPRPLGKAVWFELASAEPDADAPAYDAWDAGAGGAALAADGTVHVELRNVPLLLHVAWHQHAETLLREYLLVSLGNDDELDDDGGGLEGLMAHAAASEAIALLLEHLPAPGLDPGADADPDLDSDPDLDDDLDLERLMARSVEPGVSSPLEVVPVPPDVLASFRVLDETLDAALALADVGALLTPPTQPEVRAFRRWVCAEVLRQGAGAPATAWVPPESLAPLALPETGWAVDDVMSAVECLVAADDANRIIAVSGPALALLGYDHADELVGRRLVEVIPERYRQAHLAGVTRYLSSGRAPLLGRPVVVPALRRDGSEAELELTIGAERLDGGRHVFVAAFTSVGVATVG